MPNNPMMPPATQSQFLAWDSLGTLGGAALATLVVANALRQAFGINAAWCGFLVAQAVCVGSALHTMQSVADLPLALPLAMLNGCLVFFSATGMTEAAAGDPRTAA